jgi:hypothetical protein
MVSAEASCFTLCMTKTYYGSGQKEKPALLEFGPEPSELITAVLVTFAQNIESITVQQS